jgi:hypothetical protein
MSVRTKVKAGGPMMTLLVSAISLQAHPSAAAASSRVVHVTGTLSITAAEVVDVVSLEHQCVIHLNQTVTYEGDLEGTSQTVRPSELRYLASCDELVATGGVGIRRTFSGLEHFVGTDGREATIRDVGAADAAGNFNGISVVHGDLNGVLHETQTAASGPTATYDGLLATST